MNSYASLCDDFGVSTYLRGKLEMPSDAFAEHRLDTLEIDRIRDVVHERDAEEADLDVGRPRVVVHAARFDVPRKLTTSRTGVGGRPARENMCNFLAVSRVDCYI